MSLTLLRKLRKLNDIVLDEVARDTGLSVGYLNRIERGYVSNIKNDVKRKKLEDYIKELESKTKKDLQKTMTGDFDLEMENARKHYPSFY